MKEETLTDVPNYEGQDIVIQKMDYGRSSELSEVSTEITVEDGKEKIVVHPAKARIFTLIYGIKSAPFFEMADEKHRETAVRTLDKDTGDFLHIKIQKLNLAKYNEDLIKKSEPQPKAKQ